MLTLDLFYYHFKVSTFQWHDRMALSGSRSSAQDQQSHLIQSGLLQCQSE